MTYDTTTLRCMTLAALCCAAALPGCTTQGVCQTNPADPVCCSDCQIDRSHLWCDENEWNAGSCAEPTCDCDAPPDGGPADAGPDAEIEVDAGPCGMACADPTPLCRESDGMCVTCLGDGDCEGGTPRCDTTAGECVACLANADCGAPTLPICDEGTCRACTADTDCEAMGATPVCDEPSGQCVECTVDTEETTCPAPDNRACHPAELTCTGAERGSLGFCQGCVSDSECVTDGMGTLRCVPMQFEGSPHGTYCLRDLESYRTATSMPAAPCPDQMVTARTEMSVLGVEAEYCFIQENLATCEAVLGYRDLCPAGDADCGAPGLDDASCQTGTCTYECAASRDCATGLCTGGGPRYCQ